MKFYFWQPADSDFSPRTYKCLKDAKQDAIAAQTNASGEHQPFPVTIYKMDVSITWDTVARLLTKNGGYANEMKEVFQIGFDELQQLAKERLNQYD